MKQGEVTLQEEKEKLNKDPGIRQYRDEILGLGQDKDQMLRLQHYRDRMLGLTENRSMPKHEKLNMWSIKEGNENILRLDEYMNELTKLQETREEMLKMRFEAEGISPRIICCNDDAQTTLALAYMGMGVGLLPASGIPEFFSSSSGPKIAAKTLKEKTLYSQIALVCRLC